MPCRNRVHAESCPIIVKLLLEMISIIEKKLKNCKNTQRTYH